MWKERDETQLGRILRWWWRREEDDKTKDSDGGGLDVREGNRMKQFLLEILLVSI